MCVLMRTESMHKGFVMLDKAHAAHVCGEVVDLGCAADGDFAILLAVQIQRKIFDVVKALIPLVDGLDVYRANCGKAAFRKSATSAPPMKPPAPVTTTVFFAPEGMLYLVTEQ